MISLAPGASRTNVLDVLKDLRLSAGNLRNGSSGTSSPDYFNEYSEWCINAVRKLQQQVLSADLERLLLESPSGLHSGLLSMDINARTSRRLVDLELELRERVLGLAIEELRAVGRRWNGPGRFVVADTSFYIKHPEKLEEARFGELIGQRGVLVRLLLPMVIVDELDGGKQAGQDRSRWRAGYTLAVVDRVLVEPEKPGWLREDHEYDDGFADTTIEIVFDPPGHTRLPIVDEEIIDRSVAIQSMVGRPLLLITYDTGQSTRARAAGLEVLKLSLPLGDEPEGSPRRKEKRQPAGS